MVFHSVRRTWWDGSAQRRYGSAIGASKQVAIVNRPQRRAEHNRRPPESGRVTRSSEYDLTGTGFRRSPADSFAMSRLSTFCAAEGAPPTAG